MNPVRRWRRLDPVLVAFPPARDARAGGALHVERKVRPDVRGNQFPCPAALTFPGGAERHDTRRGWAWDECRHVVAISTRLLV